MPAANGFGSIFFPPPNASRLCQMAGTARKRIQSKWLDGWLLESPLCIGAASNRTRGADGGQIQPDILADAQTIAGFAAIRAGNDQQFESGEYRK